MILPGAVAKGAFEAGVIDALAHQDTRIDRIVATSSGALNGVAYAAGIRCGLEKEMAAKLTHAWIDAGGWANALKFNLWDVIGGKGISDSRGLKKMLQELVTPCLGTFKREVELRIIVAPLNGISGKIGETVSTTYEKVFHFSGKDFDTVEGLAKIFEVTTAACSFPGLYAPVHLDGLGPCVDGGTVNNAPIKYALDEGDIDRIIMPVPFPAIMPEAKSLRGFDLATHMIDVLVNERLYRDLKDAQVVNRKVESIDRMASEGLLTPAQAQAVKATLDIRLVQITEIRPPKSLRGNPFSGFFSKKERIRLVTEGRQAAHQALLTLHS